MYISWREVVCPSLVKGASFSTCGYAFVGSNPTATISPLFSFFYKYLYLKLY